MTSISILERRRAASAILRELRYPTGVLGQRDALVCLDLLLQGTNHWRAWMKLRKSIHDHNPWKDNLDQLLDDIRKAEADPLADAIE